jgi:DNA-directed RNA polymerase subunit K/omega
MVQKKKEKASSKRSSLTLIGPKKLTRFERARIVGARALQISMGAPVLLDLSESTMSPIQIGELELQEGVLPISIRRALPDGTSMNIPLKTLLEGERQEAEAV